MTRRSVLAAGAGALAGGLLRPHRALAALAGPPPARLREQAVGDLAAGAPRTIALARNADLVGLQWQAPQRAGLQIRLRRPGGSWSPWVSAQGHGHGPDRPAPGDMFFGEPLWTGGVRELQLRAARAVSGVLVHLVDVSGGVGARRLLGGPLAAAAALPLAAPQLAAGPGPPPIIARRAWARRVSPPAVAPEYGAVRMAFVHHTENPNGYAAGEVPAMLRAIYAFHRFVHGWNDIGYNFAIDLYGRIFEARAGGIDEPVVGAQAGGYNLASSGVAVLGTFSGVPISTPAQNALQTLLAWKLSLHGVSSAGRVTVRVNPAGASYSRFPANARVSLPRIAGHRDGDSTECPGDVLYGELPAIRARVLTLAPRPSLLTLALAPASPPVAGQPAAPGQALGGRLAFLDGTAIAGQSVQVQARTVSERGESVLERMIAAAVTDSQGNYTVPASYVAAGRGGVWLRALFAGAPGGAGATVSEGLHVAAAPALSPPPAPSPTTPAAAPPAP